MGDEEEEYEDDEDNLSEPWGNMADRGERQDRDSHTEEDNPEHSVGKPKRISRTMACFGP